MLLNIIISIMLLFSSFSYAEKKYIYKTIQEINFDRAVLNICVADQDLCKVLTDKRIYTYLRKYYKPALMSIAHIESHFKYKQGLYDKDDISYFQINKRIWTREKLIKYNMNYSYWQIKHDVRISTEVALKVWLINVAQYISKTRRYPKSLAEYIALYHRIDRICKSYKRKISRVVYRYINTM